MQLYDEINLFLYNISLLLNGKMLLKKKKKEKDFNNHFHVWPSKVST